MVIVRILARIKEHGVLVGYAAVDKQNNKHFILKQNIGQYKYINAYINRNNELIAKHGFTIRTINKEDEAEIERRRTSIIGKPRLLVVSTYSDLSRTQKEILKLLESSDKLEIDKRMYNIKITMKDLACMTAVTGLEYALFERDDKYRIVKGSSTGISLDNKYTCELINKRYTWVGHTHPGTTKWCLMASESDYETLRCLGQKQSVIYNSCGDYNVFGLGGRL